jgi:SAM-dependent methyltransferase
MPGIDENKTTWNAASSWAAQGDEWSGPWGSTELQWQGTLLPRIRAFVPTGSVLELGPGHGRWAQYLKDLCDQLTLVDLADTCIDTCKKRFRDAANVNYHVNDGKSLTMVPDGSIDFVFSFDSLVHAEYDVLEAYLGQLVDKLRPDGVGFVHHSNMGSYRRAAAIARRFPERARKTLTLRRVLVSTYAWRADTTAEDFAELCARSGLACIGQEKIPWEYGRGLTDTISVFTRCGSRWDRPALVVENRRFMEEARQLAQLGRLYGRSTFPEAATSASSST